MTSDELYTLLINFEEESLIEFGMEKDGEYWFHPHATDRFRVTDNRLLVNRGGTDIGRLNASFDDPESLYRTFIDTEVIEPATHLLYLRNKGLNV
ncbi:MAG: hypothetical protein JJ953_01455 [Gracilimonas sp.]|uniref:hypothetical protein n=1 Tax=Gracilimonas sp. TaxID=1974203 RepID=UPI001AFF838C|nr:hypothetical protein [Gracilimonas sp.]MBO6584749.1 hypothetical protein [Gracilimonas sp.]MBO6615980.1 hypothetical protein [Gracilimonas sp.]